MLMFFVKFANIMGMRNIFFEAIKVFLIVFLVVIPIRYFVFQPFIVSGASMEPSFHEADYLIVDQLSYRFSEPKRGDVIIFTNTDVSQKRYIKRIIGLPGEEIVIKDGHVFIVDDNKEETKIAENYLTNELGITEKKRGKEDVIYLEEEEYFVLGDNRRHSFDSRDWGVLSADDIIGKVLFQISFFDKFSFVQTPEY